MDHLSADLSNTLDSAIDELNAQGLLAGITVTDLDDFTDQFNNAGGIGTTFVAGMDLTNADTGAIGGADADGLAVRDAESVIADSGSYSSNPLAGFAEETAKLTQAQILQQAGISSLAQANVAKESALTFLNQALQ